MNGKGNRKKKQKNKRVKYYSSYFCLIRKRSLSFHSYPTHPIDAHITRAGIARRAVHHTVRKHDREELTFWFAVQLTRSTYTHSAESAKGEGALKKNRSGIRANKIKTRKVSYFSFGRAAMCGFRLCKVSHQTPSTARLDNWGRQPGKAASGLTMTKR
jgi:hypothetical protein